MAVFGRCSTFAPSTIRKEKRHAFHRPRLPQSLLAHMAADSNHTRLHPQQLQVLYDVQGRALPHATDGVVGGRFEGTPLDGAARQNHPTAFSQSVGFVVRPPDAPSGIDQEVSARTGTYVHRHTCLRHQEQDCGATPQVEGDRRE